jgi:hypothetical protein
MPYDKQVLILFNPDEAIRETEKAVLRKNPELNGFSIETGLRLSGTELRARLYLRLLTKESRLYLLGHGDWQSQTLGGFTAGHVCEYLRGLKAVGLISCLGCASARTEADEHRINLSNQSFVSKLHRLLWVDEDGPKLKTVMYGRVHKVLAESGAVGKKTGDTVRSSLHHRAASKVRFYWDGDTQKAEWVTYKDATEDDYVEMRKHALSRQ